MKGLLAILGLVLFMGQLSALMITEVEANPVGGKDGTEWIELYNEEDTAIDVSGWSIYDGLASEQERHVFSEDTTIASEAYLVVTFSTSVLNNGGDFVILYDSSGKEIDRTKKLSDEDKDERTWQWCDEEWVYEKETKDEDNACAVQDEEDDEVTEQNTFVEEDEEVAPENELVENEGKKKDVEKLSAPVEPREKTTASPPQPIVLEAKDIKGEETASRPPKNLGVYALVSFGLIVGALVLLSKKRYTKNEFG